MKTSTKRLGIWMDHASATLMELENGNFSERTITSSFNHEIKEQTLTKSEKEAHQKENHREMAYFKEIGKAILNFENVLLFGPTEAKTELIKMMKTDHHYDKIKIEVRPADKMTENQRQAFVKDYFQHQ